MAKTGLYLFTQDLRLSDNSLLHKAARDNDSLLMVYAVDPSHFQPGAFTLKRIGQHRWRFLLDSLNELDQQLRGLNQQLHILFSQARLGIGQLIEQHQISSIYASEQVGYYEQQLIIALQADFPDIRVYQACTHRLWNLDELPLSLESLPASFTQFRKQVEHLPVLASLPKVTALPPPPPNFSPNQLQTLPSSSQSTQAERMGGELSAQAHLHTYFASDYPSSYKETRNALDGNFNSTGFSPWLANGCLSVRQVVEALKRYETTKGANESTYWIFFELMWREFFQLYALRYGSQLFQFRGTNGRKPLTSFYPQRFKAWCEGETQWPLVNACMKQLKQTGWISNRGRQVVASCLVNELQIDWRYGAAWFEQQLIDYDVASNWGNWQYLAGVGADPRGTRQFNLQKQTETYDPQGHFILRWQGRDTAGTPLYAVDAADWPLDPKGSNRE